MVKRKVQQIALIFITAAFGTTVFAAEPGPLYTEVYRDAENDTDVDLYMNNWRDSDISIGHGGFVEQAYLTRGNPLDPQEKGAVLKFFKAYNHGILAEGSTTEYVKTDDEQLILFVLDGSGIVEAGGAEHNIREGSGVFVPAGIEYRFRNTGAVPMHVVIVVEEAPSGFEPQGHVSIGNWHDNMPHAGIHWCHVGRSVFTDKPKFVNPISGPSVVSIESFDAAHPHAHVENCEEIWNQIEGESFMMIGKYFRRQPEGTAVLIPPTGKDPHSSINPDDTPKRWLYFGNRHDRD